MSSTKDLLRRKGVGLVDGGENHAFLVSESVETVPILPWHEDDVDPAAEVVSITKPSSWRKEGVQVTTDHS